MRRLLLLAAVVALVTLAFVYGPAFYPRTPASERAPLLAWAIPSMGSRSGVAKERGRPATVPARAKLGETSRPLPAGATGGVKQDKSAPISPITAVPPAPAAEPAGVMVGPDGVIIRRVSDGDTAKK